MAKALENKTMSQTVIEILKDRVLEISSTSEKKITETDSFEGLEMDSLDRFELSYHIEQEFGISIPDEDMWNLENVRDYVNYIESHKYK
jgi:acyl carrier protein